MSLREQSVTGEGSLAELKAALARAERERDEALAQQAATAEVLKVISASPGALEPVFQAVLKNATKICEAKFGTLYLAEAGKCRMAAMHNAPPAFADFQMRRGVFEPTAGAVLDQVMRTKQVWHSADAGSEAVAGNAAKLAGARSLVGVPMFKDDALVGAIVIYRQEVRPFTDKQIELVQNFADQAVIAIENVRLFEAEQQRTDELAELLEQQTATSEVLKVISTSPGNLQPVFAAMLANATRICDAKFGVMFLVRWRKIRTDRAFGVTPEYAALLEQRGRFKPDAEKRLRAPAADNGGGADYRRRLGIGARRRGRTCGKVGRRTVAYSRADAQG